MITVGSETVETLILNLNTKLSLMYKNKASVCQKKIGLIYNLYK